MEHFRDVYYIDYEKIVLKNVFLNILCYVCVTYFILRVCYTCVKEESHVYAVKSISDTETIYNRNCL